MQLGIDIDGRRATKHASAVRGAGDLERAPDRRGDRYDASDQGHYSWHTDFAGLRPHRKISISVQLSAAEDYDGGDLELLYSSSPLRLAKDRGTFLAFPSFMLHRVTPVTRGTRWSLVAWIVGNRWR